MHTELYPIQVKAIFDKSLCLGRYRAKSKAVREIEVSFNWQVNQSHLTLDNPAIRTSQRVDSRVKAARDHPILKALSKSPAELTLYQRNDRL
jgi:hypothetical protein